MFKRLALFFILCASLAWVEASCGSAARGDQPTGNQVTDPMRVGGPWINVKSFGALGNGSVNDHDAIQAAIDAAGTNGGTVFFPPGAYYVTSSLTDTHVAGQTNIELRGAGSSGWGGVHGISPPVSSIVSDQNIIIADFGSSSRSNSGGLHIVNLGFVDTSNEGTGGYATGAIRIQREHHIQMQDVSCTNFSNAYCIQLNSLGGDWVQYGSFIDIKSSNTKFGFQALGPSTQMVILGGHFTAPSSSAGSIGIDIEQPTDAVPYNTDTYQILNPSLEGFQTAIKIYNGDAHRIMARIENNDEQGIGVLIDGSPSHASTGNIIMGTMITRVGTGIQLTDRARHTQIIGNVISDVGPGGDIAVDNLASPTTLIVGLNEVDAQTGSGGVRWRSGSDVPSGPCATGGLYLRNNGGPGSTLYVCESGAWAPK